MKQWLGGVLVGVLAAGVISAIVIPVLPPSTRDPWVVWAIALASIGASVYLVRRGTRTPPR